MTKKIQTNLFLDFLYYFRSFGLNKKERKLLYSIYKSNEDAANKKLILRSISILSKYRPAFKLLEKHTEPNDIQFQIIRIIMLETSNNLWGLLLNLSNLYADIMPNEIFYAYIVSIKNHPLKEVKDYLNGKKIYSDNYQMDFINHLFKTDCWNILRNICKKFPDIFNLLDPDLVKLFIKLNKNESKLFLHAFDSMKGNINNSLVINKIFSLLRSKNFRKYIDHLSDMKFTTYLTLANIFKTIDDKKRNTIIEAFEYSFFLKLLIRLEYFYINNPMHLNYFVYFFKLDIRIDLRISILAFFKNCFDRSFSLGIDVITIFFRELYHNSDNVIAKTDLALALSNEKEFIFFSRFICLILDEKLSIDTFQTINTTLHQKMHSEYEYLKFSYFFEKLEKISVKIINIVILSLNEQSDLLKFSKYIDMIYVLEKHVGIHMNFSNDAQWFENAINIVISKISHYYNIDKDSVKIKLKEMIFIIENKFSKDEKEKIKQIIINSASRKKQFSSKILATCDIEPIRKIIDPAELSSKLILGLLKNNITYTRSLKKYFNKNIINKIKKNISIKQELFSDELDIEYLKFCYEPAVKSISEKIITTFSNIEELVELIRSIQSLYNNNNSFYNKLSVKIQDHIINDISDNTKFMCSKFFPTGKNKNYAIDMYNDDTIYLLHIVPNIDEKYFNEPLGVIICCICNDIENNTILLIDSVEIGIELYNIKKNLLLNLILRSIKKFNSLIKADTVFLNINSEKNISYNLHKYLTEHKNYQENEIILQYTNKSAHVLNTFKECYEIKTESKRVMVSKIKGISLTTNLI